MSFLLTSTTATPPAYRRLGYATNPFPVRAEVRREIYVERPEVERVQQELSAFVLHGGTGAMWAIEGASGVGKTNLLQHIAWELEQRDDVDSPPVAHRYLTGQLVQPRQLQQEVVLAIGQERFAAWLGSRPEIPSYLTETNLGRLLASLRNTRVMTEAAAFVARWLSGDQTYAEERKQFHVEARERLEPGSALPYLRFVVDGLVTARKLSGIVLLLDEQEDTMVVGRNPRGAYLMALKGLVNAFNFQHLFVVLTGTPGVFASLGQEHVSLASRWKIVRLMPIQGADQAWELARAHMRFAALDAAADSLLPSQETVEATFGRLAGGKGSVTQRDLLETLHRWVEDEARKPARTGAG